jgi:hypothetical protein
MNRLATFMASLVSEIITSIDIPKFTIPIVLTCVHLAFSKTEAVPWDATITLKSPYELMTSSKQPLPLQSILKL